MADVIDFPKSGKQKYLEALDIAMRNQADPYYMWKIWRALDAGGHVKHGQQKDLSRSRVKERRDEN